MRNPASGPAPVDIQAALTVIGRRDVLHDRRRERPDLGGTCLAGVNVDRAKPTGANLTGAKLTGAKLTGANLTGANLSDAVYDESTQWPVGFTPPPR